MESCDQNPNMNFRLHPHLPVLLQSSFFKAGKQGLQISLIFARLIKGNGDTVLVKDLITSKKATF